MNRPLSVEQAVAHWSEQLIANGYCVIPNALPDGVIEELDGDLAEDFDRTPFCTGDFYGARTKRFGRLLARSPIAAELVQHELILGVVRAVLSPWCDTVQLNLTQALALHPGAAPQLPHRDQDMWRGAIGEVEYLVNVMWPFTRYTAENGATVVWPNSHGRQALDPESPAGEFAAELEPGSALLFLGSTLHGAGGNSCNEVRRGAIVSKVLTPRRPQGAQRKNRRTGQKRKRPRLRMRRRLLSGRNVPWPCARAELKTAGQGEPRPEQRTPFEPLNLSTCRDRAARSWELRRVIGGNRS